MQINSSTQGGWTVLTLTGKIDHAGADELKTALAPHLAGGALALDFTGVEYVTSSGFRVLLQAFKDLRAAGGQMILGNMSSSLRGFFDMAGLSTVFKITHDIRTVIDQAP